MRTDSSLSDLVKACIKDESNSLFEYIEYGEEKEYNKKPTCKARKVWFDIGELLRPQFIFPDVYWRRTSVPLNADRIAVDKQLYALIPKKGIDEFVLGGILNSDVNPLMRELHGRTVGGEGLNRNQVMVWEANVMPVIDPRKLSEEQRNRISKAFKQLLEECRRSSEEETLKLRHELNKSVMSAIGLDEKTEELENEVKGLIEIRVGGGGSQKNIMVEHETPAKEIKLKGAQVISKRNSLDRYLK